MSKLLKVFREIHKVTGNDPKAINNKVFTIDDVLTRCQKHDKTDGSCRCEILGGCFAAIKYADVKGRRVYIYGHGKELLYDYRGTLGELKDCIILHQKDHGYYFNRSFILNLDVFKDIFFSSLSNNKIAIVLAEWGTQVVPRLLTEIREKVKIMRKSE
ncbi:MAG: hypothetical protein ACRCXN_06335 [Bacteroidales bacterium]